MTSMSWGSRKGLQTSNDTGGVMPDEAGHADDAYGAYGDYDPAAGDDHIEYHYGDDGDNGVDHNPPLPSLDDSDDLGVGDAEIDFDEIDGDGDDDPLGILEDDDPLQIIDNGDDTDFVDL